jgi:hypothetical protein
MDARIDGQFGGVVHSVPTRGSGSVPESRAPAPAAGKRVPDSDAPQGPPAEVFDANGDGTIEHWSYSHGGDSYATFKPPPSGAAGANLRRVGHTPAAAAASAAHAARRANAHTSTAAAIHHAHEAYQRDGSANAPDTHAPAPAASTPATVATVTPAPKPPASHVTQTNGAPALPSPRP